MKPKAVKRALLVGINRYPDGRNNLKGCVNDVLMMSQVLTERYAFSPEHIRLLTDERATTTNMRERLHWLVRDAAPGSVLVFHYSGHGSQVRDRDGDEMTDGLDEILCPYDLSWDDPFTDDEIATVVKEVPEGVNFTIILDCCHSGTGMREYFKEPETGRVPSTKYLVPPPDIAFRGAAGVVVDGRSEARTVCMSGVRATLPVRRFGTRIVRKDENAILIAGCRAEQTSADAWIDNDNHGALTYALNMAIERASGVISSRDLAQEAASWLAAHNFDQEPQLEGSEAIKEWGFLKTEPVRRSATAVSMGRRQETAPIRAIDPDTRIVFIHGIGDHSAGYSIPWREAFNNWLGLEDRCFTEVLWDDVFDRKGTGEREAKALPELGEGDQARMEDLTGEIREILGLRLNLVEDVPSLLEGGRGPEIFAGTPALAERGILNWLLNFDEYIGDFVKYLVSPKIRATVDDRLKTALTPLFGTTAPVVLISHSWGTVISHHALQDVHDGRLAIHATLGSPLWMRPIRRVLKFDGRTHACDRWINIDARGDLIGGALHAIYPICQDFIVPSVGPHPHASYFHPENTRVQRDIVAATIAEIPSVRPAAAPRAAAGRAVAGRAAAKGRKAIRTGGNGH